MNKQEIKQILNLNKEFYQKTAFEFSRTRQHKWRGWGRVVDIIEKERNKLIKSLSNKSSVKIKIIDLGCGNGRFLKHLLNNYDNFEYLGVDINNDFLKEARDIPIEFKNKKAKFIQEDVFENLDKIPGQYNVITAFGVTHHIPDEKFRKKWFVDLLKLLNKDSSRLSIIALSFWNFAEKPGGYLVSWNKNKDLPRFCYKYPQEELDWIKKTYKRNGLDPISCYESDNKNIYLIFGRI